jgi:lipopolysaccharide biosynthesis glycosyltransferase
MKTDAIYVNDLSFNYINDPILQDDPIVIVCAADDNYAMPLAVMARSVLENLKDGCDLLLFVIDGGIKNYNKQKILKSLFFANCVVKFVPKPDPLSFKRVEEVNKYCDIEGITMHKDTISIATYYRLFLPELIPVQIEKVIYLDCDLVVEEDILNLWKADLEDNYLLAAEDFWIHSVSAHNGLLNYKKLGIDQESKYFNAGVLVINLKKWRSDEITAKAIEYLIQNKEYIRFHDQDVLNGLLAGQWGQLDPRWNLTPGIYDYYSEEESLFPKDIYDNLIRHPYIIHFASGTKPWNSCNVYYKEHFFKYLDKTEWKGWRFTFWKELQLNLAYKFQKLKTLIGKSLISK